MANMIDDTKSFSFISNEDVESNIFKLFVELHAHQLIYNLAVMFHRITQMSSRKGLFGHKKYDE